MAAALPATVGAKKETATMTTARRRKARHCFDFGGLSQNMNIKFPARSTVTDVARRLLILWSSRLRGFAEATAARARLAGDHGTGDHRSADQCTVDERTYHDLLCQAPNFDS